VPLHFFELSLLFTRGYNARPGGMVSSRQMAQLVDQVVSACHYLHEPQTFLSRESALFLSSRIIKL